MKKYEWVILFKLAGAVFNLALAGAWVTLAIWAAN